MKHVSRESVEKGREVLKRAEEVISMGGLGSSAPANREWEEQYGAKGHTVVQLTPTNEELRREEWDFSARVRKIKDYILSHPDKEKNFILVGESAGGLAVLCAAADKEINKRIVKVNANAPAMPEGISVLSMSLLAKMVPYMAQIIFGENIQKSKKSDRTYRELIAGGLDEEVITEALTERRDMAATEIRQLTGFPIGKKPVLNIRDIPNHIAVTMMTGDKDAWVKYGAQYRLARKLADNLGDRFNFIRLHNVGHLVSLSKRGKATVERVLKLDDDTSRRTRTAGKMSTALRGTQSRAAR